jgi:hypothetical protein
VHDPLSGQDVVDLIGLELVSGAGLPNSDSGMSERIAPKEGVVAVRMKQLAQEGEITGDDIGTVSQTA